MANKIVGKYDKDPDSNLDYPITWDKWLEPGDSITGVVWIVPTDLTQTDADLASPLTTIWLSGGTTNVEYEVVARVTTAAGRIDDAAILLTII